MDIIEQNIEVDENDQILGLRPRTDFYTGNYIHRSAHLILFNSKDEILIQKRAATKKWYPGLYTYSASGTVADEGYEDCIKREGQEEIGTSTPIKFIFKYSHFDESEKAFHAVFIGKSDDKIKPDHKEMSEIKWISIRELEDDIKTHPEKYTPPFVVGMKKYFTDFYHGNRAIN